MKYVIANTYEAFAYIALAQADGYYENITVANSLDEIPSETKEEDIVSLNNKIENVKYFKTINEALTFLKENIYIVDENRINQKILELLVNDDNDGDLFDIEEENKETTVL